MLHALWTPNMCRRQDHAHSLKNKVTLWFSFAFFRWCSHLDGHAEQLPPYTEGKLMYVRPRARSLQLQGMVFFQLYYFLRWTYQTHGRCTVSCGGTAQLQEEKRTFAGPKLVRFQVGPKPRGLLALQESAAPRPPCYQVYWGCGGCCLLAGLPPASPCRSRLLASSSS